MYCSNSRHPLFSVGGCARPGPRVFALAAVIWLGACGDGQPPVACGSIPQQTVHTGDREVVTPCFEDPEMEPIRLSTESSNSEVVAASISGSAVQLRGVSPGNATVTVTATDPDSLSAQVRFEVMVPNRAPEVIRTIPGMRIPPGRSGGVLLFLFFIDPDGQDLTYRAEISDPNIATGSVADDVLSVTAGNVGSATATVTATDPGGLSVSQTFTVSVEEPQRLIRDDFETDESLANWTLTDNSEARVDDGRFWLENTDAQFLALASASLFATQWKVTASMGNATGSAWAALVVGADHEVFSAYQIQIGADGNSFGLGETDYRFLILDASTPTWFYDDGWYGQSDAIGDVGELTTIAIAAEGDALTVTAGSTELLRIDLTGTVLSGDANFVALVSWPAPQTTGQPVFFDWVEVTGIALGEMEPDMRLKRRLADMLRPFREIGPGTLIRPLEGGLIGAGGETPRGNPPGGAGRRDR